MRTFDIVDPEGRLLAFEVSTFLLSRRGIVRLLAGISGVRLVKTGRLPAPSEDEFCEFECGLSRFAVWEPFGDSTRFHVGPKPMAWTSEISLIREQFQKSHRLRFFLF